MPTPRSNLTIAQCKALAKTEKVEEYYPNGVKVSKADNPMVFPVENTYQIGSAEILALMSNTIAVGTGQTGAAPLYVFCKDGVYALFVDASGQMTYSNARVLARDVCNNARSVTPIDAGVVFTTDRGLMMIAGEQVQEIGQPAEGDVLQYWNEGSVDYTKIAAGAFVKVAELPTSLFDETDFLTYIKEDSIVNYNHNERELMISNPHKSYSYILDRNGNWSRRDYTADQYVNNYPTSYRLVDGEFYKVDEEGDDTTLLEEKKEADNEFFYLSNVIKLGSIGFKEPHRFVVRGLFETITRQVSPEPQPTYFWQVIGKFMSPANFYGSDANVLYNLSAYLTNEINIGNELRITNLSFQFPQDVTVTNKITGPNRIILSADLNAYSSAGPYKIQKKYAIEPPVVTDPHIGVYVFGSYDGRKWAMLGGNEKKGKFTDIGCKIERTDVKFLRICLAGQATGKTRIDYMEISSLPSVLNTKIR